MSLSEYNTYITDKLLLSSQKADPVQIIFKEHVFAG